MRAALGASHGALRRTLLAESLVLCGAGAILGVLMAGPLVSVVARYAARFSVRALDVGVDNTVVWVGAGLAMAAAVLLAYVPRLPSSNAAAGLGIASERPADHAGHQSSTAGVRDDADRVLVRAARRRGHAGGRAHRPADGEHRLPDPAGPGLRHPAGFAGVCPATPPPPTGSAPSANPPAPSPPPPAPDLYREVTQRVGQLPGVDGVVGSLFVPWRDSGRWPHVQFTVEGYTPANGEDNPYARRRSVGPGFFATLGIPVVAGREFTEDDRTGKEPVVIVSQTVAQRLFPNGEALNRKLWVTAALSQSGGQNAVPSRIVGVVADVDDETGRQCAGHGALQPVPRQRACRCACSCGRRAIRTRWCRR